MEQKDCLKNIDYLLFVSMINGVTKRVYCYLHCKNKSQSKKTLFLKEKNVLFCVLQK